jgi:hypothetical protein
MLMPGGAAMRVLRFIRLAVGLTLLVTLGFVVGARTLQSSHAATSPTGTSGADGGPDATVDTQTETEVHKGVTVTLSPPDSGSSPSITAADARSKYGQGIEEVMTPSAIEVTLADLSDPGLSIPDNTLVWAIKYSGVCVPVYGPAPGSDEPHELPDCAGDQLTVLVDASTGEYIETYSDG